MFGASSPTLLGEDCNRNELLDDVEILEGWTSDCNENGVPDSCEVEQGTSDDCNANGIPDDCDLFPQLALSERVTVDLPTELYDAVVSDVNNDTIPDLVGLSAPLDTSHTQRLSLLINDGRNNFAEVWGIELEKGPKSMLAVDGNADSATDVVVAMDGGPIVLFENTGTGTFWSQIVVDQGPARIDALRAADFDNNGLIDFVTVGDGLVRVIYQRDSGFSVRLFDIPRFCPTTPAVGDIDSDGDTDILISNDGCLRNDYDVLGGLPMVALFENRGDGTFLIRLRRFDIPIYNPRVLDVDADGAVDVVVRRGGVLFNNGDGTFGQFVSHECGFTAQSMDVDGDGDQDFVGGQIACVNHGNRSFTRHTLLSFSTVIPADFDGDGLDDILSYVRGESSVFLRFNRTTAALGTDTDGDGKLDACAVEFRRGDCTDDGQVNVTDAMCVFYHVLGSAGTALCEKSADVDDSGGVTIIDGVLLLRMLFVGGSAPSGTELRCGSDPTGDTLRCPRAHECTAL